MLWRGLPGQGASVRGRRCTSRQGTTCPAQRLPRAQGHGSSPGRPRAPGHRENRPSAPRGASAPERVAWRADCPAGLDGPESGRRPLFATAAKWLRIETIPLRGTESEENEKSAGLQSSRGAVPAPSTRSVGMVHRPEWQCESGGIPQRCPDDAAESAPVPPGGVRLSQLPRHHGCRVVLAQFDDVKTAVQYPSSKPKPT